MNFIGTRYFSWHGLALLVLLCYPVMASSYLPFGGGARYLSVLAAPTCLILLISQRRVEWPVQLRSALLWSRPFAPMVVGWIVVRIWHHYTPIDPTPLSRLLLAALLYMGARIVGVKYWQLGYAAAIGALACGLIACIDVFVMGRGRAWGGVYENRFAQYSVWLAVLCLLHAIRFSEEGGPTAKRWLLVAAIPIALTGALLTGSRGALLALPTAIVVVIVRSFTGKRALLLVAVTLVLSLLIFFGYEPFRQRTIVAFQEFIAFFQEGNAQTSIGIRLELARVAVLSMSAHPMLGVGYKSLGELYAQYPQLLGVMPESVADIPSFHSDWFHAIGVGGLTLLSCLLTTVTWLFIEAKRNVYRTSFVTCAVVFSISELFFWHKMGLSLLVTTWALYSAAEDRH